MSQVDKKVRFIIAWYNNECSKLVFSDGLKLARIWIDICLKDEEYEMAAAIKIEKQKLIRKHIKEKKSKRRFSQKAIIFIYLTKRKIKVWIKNKLSR